MGKVEVIESEIVNLIRKGEGDLAMKFLYKKVFPQVKNFVSQRKGKNDEAFDVFQDALLELYQRILTHDYPEQFTVCGYLYRLATFKWLNKNKRDQKFMFSESVSEIALDESDGFEELKENKNVFEELFSKIGEKCVELLTHTFIYELSLEEIQQKLGFVSLGAVKMQHARCKEKLQKLVAERPHLKELLRDRIKN